MNLAYFFNYQTRLKAKKFLMSKGKTEKQALAIIKQIDNNTKSMFESNLKKLTGVS